MIVVRPVTVTPTLSLKPWYDPLVSTGRTLTWKDLHPKTRQAVCVVVNKEIL